MDGLKIDESLIPKIVGIVVAVIVTSVVLIPITEEVTATTETFENKGVFNYGLFTPDDDYTLTFDATTGELTVNDVVVPGFDTLNKAYSIIATDDYLARYGSTSGGYYLQNIGYEGANLFVDSGVTATITISEGDLSVTWVKADNTTVTKTVTFTEMYAIVPTTDTAVMKVSSEEVYIKGDSELYASGLTTITLWANIFHFEGTYDDGITISSPTFPTATYDNITWNIEPVSGYVDLYKLTSIEFDITYNGEVTHAVYSYFGVPSTVTAEKAIHADAMTNTIISLIPIFVVLAILMGIVGLMYFNRNGQ